MSSALRSPRPGVSRIGGLVALNAVLLGVLAAVTFSPAADAQARRVRGSYEMVGGTVQGTQASVVYLVDTANHQLAAVTYLPNEQTLTGIGSRDLAADAYGR